MKSHEIVLCHPVRTAIGAFNGSFRDVPATALGAAAVRETLRRAGGIDLSAIDSVVLGNVIQAGNRMNPARQASVAGGVPVAVPALTVNRVCGSGAQAIASIATEIAAGVAQLGIAGGMENMDRAPYLLDGGRHGYRMGNAEIHDSMLRDGLVDAFSGEHSGWHTEDLVTQLDITREAQDRWAERSQQRFAAAQAKRLVRCGDRRHRREGGQADRSRSHATNNRAPRRRSRRSAACVRRSGPTARSPRAMRRG